PLGDVERDLLRRGHRGLREPGGAGRAGGKRAERGRGGAGNAKRGGAAHEVAAADLASGEFRVEAGDLDILRRGGIWAHGALRRAAEEQSKWAPQASGNRRPVSTTRNAS